MRTTDISIFNTIKVQTPKCHLGPSSLAVQVRKQMSRDHHNPPVSNMNIFHSMHPIHQLTTEYEQEPKLVRELLNIKSFGDI